jgi:hypothetical protein
MSGKWITKQQVKIYMKARSDNQTQTVSAAKAGVSVRSARAIEQGKRPDPKAQRRHWRTRPDPLAKVWTSVLEPMLEATPQLQAITLLEWLQSEYPDQYDDSLLRTLQRRVKQWKSIKGPEKEVMFRQQHEPGQLGLSDFTQLKRMTITIAGQRFHHLLYHFRLIYSKWSYIKVINGGESYPALAEGLQDALLCLGGAPANHRTDSLSAAFKNLSQEAQDDMSQSYEAFCYHYNMKGSRNNPGRGHENGGVESPHGHLKRRIEQALLLRDSCDFASVADYQSFIGEVVRQHNRRHAKMLAHERAFLQPLPQTKAVDYKLVQGVVSSSSTIDVRKVTYTVPSQLEGQTLQVRLYDNRLECYLGRELVITLMRVYPVGKTTRARLINYKHVIHSLIKKPQAFRYSQLRDDLLPSVDYKMIWDYVNRTMESKTACRFIVGLLHLAATQDCEKALAKVVLERIAQTQPLSLAPLESRFRPTTTQVPDIAVEQHSLQHYNDLLPTQEVRHA